VTLRRVVRLSGFLVVCCCFLFCGLLAQLGLSVASARTRLQVFARFTQVWARTLLALLGWQVRLCGQSIKPNAMPALLVANHQSYLDILICAAHLPALFVAKQELRQWPLLGWLAALGGTLFLDRASTPSAVRCAFRASRALRTGASVQVFPEGTTSTGAAVLDFKPLFFAAALRANVAIQPLTIVVQSVNGVAADEAARALFCWVGDADFVSHFWQLLGVRTAEVALVLHEPLLPTHRLGARELAQAARASVLVGLSVSVTSANAASAEVTDGIWESIGG
jgi:1-acyl-sn-glycerol-3-phosphate acyltransferase